MIIKFKYLLLNLGCTMTSKHTLEESSNPLAKLDYIPLLDEILQLIQKINFLSYLKIKIDF